MSCVCNFKPPYAVLLCVVVAQGYYADLEFTKEQMAEVDKRVEAMKAAATK